MNKLQQLKKTHNVLQDVIQQKSAYKQSDIDNKFNTYIQAVSDIAEQDTLEVVVYQFLIGVFFSFILKQRLDVETVYSYAMLHLHRLTKKLNVNNVEVKQSLVTKIETGMLLLQSVSALQIGVKHPEKNKFNLDQYEKKHKLPTWFSKHITELHNLQVQQNPQVFAEVQTYLQYPFNTNLIAENRDQQENIQDKFKQLESLFSNENMIMANAEEKIACFADVCLLIAFATADIKHQCVERILTIWPRMSLMLNDYADSMSAEVWQDTEILNAYFYFQKGFLYLIANVEKMQQPTLVKCYMESMCVSTQKELMISSAHCFREFDVVDIYFEKLDRAIEYMLTVKSTSVFYYKSQKTMLDEVTHNVDVCFILTGNNMMSRVYHFMVRVLLASTLTNVDLVKTQLHFACESLLEIIALMQQAKDVVALIDFDSLCFERVIAVLALLLLDITGDFSSVRDVFVNKLKVSLATLDAAKRSLLKLDKLHQCLNDESELTLLKGAKYQVGTLYVSQRCHFQAYDNPDIEHIVGTSNKIMILENRLIDRRFTSSVDALHFGKQICHIVSSRAEEVTVRQAQKILKLTTYFIELGQHVSKEDQQAYCQLLGECLDHVRLIFRFVVDARSPVYTFVKSHTKKPISPYAEVSQHFYWLRKALMTLLCSLEEMALRDEVLAGVILLFSSVHDLDEINRFIKVSGVKQGEQVETLKLAISYLLSDPFAIRGDLNAAENYSKCIGNIIGTLSYEYRSMVFFQMIKEWNTLLRRQTSAIFLVNNPANNTTEEFVNLKNNMFALDTNLMSLVGYIGAYLCDTQNKVAIGHEFLNAMSTVLKEPIMKRFILSVIEKMDEPLLATTGFEFRYQLIFLLSSLELDKNDTCSVGLKKMISLSVNAKHIWPDIQKARLCLACLDDMSLCGINTIADINQVLFRLYQSNIKPDQCLSMLQEQVSQINKIVIKVEPQDISQSDQHFVFQFVIDQFVMNAFLMHLYSNYDQSSDALLVCRSKFVMISKFLRQSFFVGLTDDLIRKNRHQVECGVKLLLAYHAVDLSLLFSNIKDLKLDLSQQLNRLAKDDFVAELEALAGNEKTIDRFISYNQWRHTFAEMSASVKNEKNVLFGVSKQYYKSRGAIIAMVNSSNIFQLHSDSKVKHERQDFSDISFDDVSNERVPYVLTSLIDHVSAFQMNEDEAFLFLKGLTVYIAKVSAMAPSPATVLDNLVELVLYSTSLYSVISPARHLEFITLLSSIFNKFSPLYRYWSGKLFYKQAIRTELELLLRSHYAPKIVHQAKRNLINLTLESKDEKLIETTIGLLLTIVSADAELDDVLGLLNYYFLPIANEDAVNRPIASVSGIENVVDYLFDDLFETFYLGLIDKFIAVFVKIASCIQSSDYDALLTLVHKKLAYEVTKIDVAKKWLADKPAYVSSIADIKQTYRDTFIMGRPIDFNMEIAMLTQCAKPDADDRLVERFLEVMIAHFNAMKISSSLFAGLSFREFSDIPHAQLTRHVQVTRALAAQLINREYIDRQLTLANIMLARYFAKSISLAESSDMVSISAESALLNAEDNFLLSSSDALLVAQFIIAALLSTSAMTVCSYVSLLKNALTSFYRLVENNNALLMRDQRIPVCLLVLVEKMTLYIKPKGNQDLQIRIQIGVLLKKIVKRVDKAMSESELAASDITNVKKYIAILTTQFAQAEFYSCDARRSDFAQVKVELGASQFNGLNLFKNPRSPGLNCAHYIDALHSLPGSAESITDLMTELSDWTNKNGLQHDEVLPYAKLVNLFFSKLKGRAPVNLDFINVFYSVLNHHSCLNKQDKAAYYKVVTELFSYLPDLFLYAFDLVSTEEERMSWEVIDRQQTDKNKDLYYAFITIVSRYLFELTDTKLIGQTIMQSLAVLATHGRPDPLEHFLMLHSVYALHDNDELSLHTISEASDLMHSVVKRIWFSLFYEEPVSVRSDDKVMVVYDRVLRFLMQLQPNNKVSFYITDMLTTYNALLAEVKFAKGISKHNRFQPRANGEINIEMSKAFLQTVKSLARLKSVKSYNQLMCLDERLSYLIACVDEKKADILSAIFLKNFSSRLNDGRLDQSMSAWLFYLKPNIAKLSDLLLEQVVKFVFSVLMREILFTLPSWCLFLKNNLSKLAVVMSENSKTLSSFINEWRRDVINLKQHRVDKLHFTKDDACLLKQAFVLSEVGVLNGEKPAKQKKQKKKKVKNKDFLLRKQQQQTEDRELRRREMEREKTCQLEAEQIRKIEQESKAAMDDIGRFELDCGDEVEVIECPDAFIDNNVQTQLEHGVDAEPVLTEVIIERETIGDDQQQAALDETQMTTMQTTDLPEIDLDIRFGDFYFRAGDYTIMSASYNATPFEIYKDYHTGYTPLDSAFRLFKTAFDQSTNNGYTHYLCNVLKHVEAHSTDSFLSRAYHHLSLDNYSASLECIDALVVHFESQNFDASDDRYEEYKDAALQLKICMALIYFICGKNNVLATDMFRVNQFVSAYHLLLSVYHELAQVKPINGVVNTTKCRVDVMGSFVKSELFSYLKKPKTCLFLKKLTIFSEDERSRAAECVSSRQLKL